MISGVAVAKDGYWKDPRVLEEHAKRRRERYASEPDLAKAERARQRKLYRQKTGEEFRNPAREALHNGVREDYYAPSDISRCLERAEDYVARLIARGLWPEPTHRVGTRACFDRAEAQRLLEVFADHIDDVASTYRKDHTATTEALFAAVSQRRNP